VQGVEAVILQVFKVVIGGIGVPLTRIVGEARECSSCLGYIGPSDRGYVRNAADYGAVGLIAYLIELISFSG
jgi:hypothetical protein